jgi:hypothetical protein
VRLALHLEKPELLEHGVILLQDSVTPHHHCDVQNLVHHWGQEVLVHLPCFTDLTTFDYWFLASVKECLWGK